MMQGESLERAATRAWCALRGAAAEPSRIDVLKQERDGAAVYRLHGAGEASSPVIAKRSPHTAAAIERVVYEQILKEFPLPVPRYYGAAEEPSGEFCWLFLEDVTGKRYRPDTDAHRLAAARWLGALHGSIAPSAAAEQLPSRRPDHYLELLRAGRAALRFELASRAPEPCDAAVLERVVRHCDRLSERWSELEGACEGVPDTLVHGDFITHNVYVRSEPSGLVLLPFDWEKAGWGVPAEDISSVDIDAYWESVRDCWPALDRAALQRLASAGRIFRCLVFLDWATPGLASDHAEQAIDDIELCGSWLDRLMEGAAWLR
jgi:hypothetical protein